VQAAKSRPLGLELQATLEEVPRRQGQSLRWRSLWAPGAALVLKTLVALGPKPDVERASPRGHALLRHPWSAEAMEETSPGEIQGLQGASLRASEGAALTSHGWECRGAPRLMTSGTARIERSRRSLKTSEHGFGRQSARKSKSAGKSSTRH
jgi:hypothetical protein